ncbi:F17F8.10 [Arabidopsis thaliana]|uniref:F17F8.10 n=1 Tax=Arabidopsis thaliana TaxID=3702 RepID=Q9FYI9_ARATH|nr:F17F8.10 [Arabidopsis thaliana]
MDNLVFTMVGEWKCKEEKWKFEPEEDMFGRCVRVKENMTYTEFVCTSIEINPIISYWIPREMLVMIDTKRPPVYIDSQVRTLRNNVSRTHGDDAESDREDDIEDDKTDEDEDGGGDNEDGDGTIDPTIDGSESSGEDYDYNKWNDEIVEEYGIGNVEENIILTQLTVQHPREFSLLLAECTYTSQRVPGGDNISHPGDRTPANRKVIQQTMSYLAIKQSFCYKQPRSYPTRLVMVCVDDTCP